MSTENDNKRKRPSQCLIDMMNGGWEKLEEERNLDFSHEPIYDNSNKKLNISAIMNMLPSIDEIKKKSQIYDNEMTSIAESIWMPRGFEEGAKWVVEHLKQRMISN